MAGPPQPPALDGGEMLAHGIDLADRRARAEQRAGDRLLVRKRDPRRRQGKQRRAAPGDEAEREIVRSQSLGHGEDARRGLAAAGIRHRMRRLDHLDRPRRHAVAVPGDDEAFEGTLPMIFHGLRHRRCRLAGAHHDGAAGGRLRQVRRQAARRPGTRESRVQQSAQNDSRIFAHASPCQSRTPASSAAPAPAGAAQALQGATGYHAAPAVTHRYGSGDTGARP